MAKFKEWVVHHDRGAVTAAVGSQGKALAYQQLINMAVESFFPLVTMRRKSTDPPWINAKARRLMRRQKAEYTKPREIEGLEKDEACPGEIAERKERKI